MSVSESVSSWLVFADKLCKDRLCLHGDVGSAPLWPRRLSPPYRRSSGAYPGANLGREPHSLVSVDHLDVTHFRQTFIPPPWAAPLACLPRFLQHEPPHWFVFNEESFRLSDIISGSWVIAGHLAQLPTSLLGNWVIVASRHARIL